MTPSMKLLLVEDEGLIRLDLKDALAEAGFDVTEAANGEKALSEFEADASRFRGLITDINLGKGPDGWEVARRGRELIRDLPVLYISAHAPADWPSKGVPNSLIVSKPFAVAQIITAISTLLVEADSHRARDSSA
jgi:two-component system, cell cycle response regulator CpdR